MTCYQITISISWFKPLLGTALCWFGISPQRLLHPQIWHLLKSPICFLFPHPVVTDAGQHSNIYLHVAVTPVPSIELSLDCLTFSIWRLSDSNSWPHVSGWISFLSEITFPFSTYRFLSPPPHTICIPHICMCPSDFLLLLHTSYLGECITAVTYYTVGTMWNLQLQHHLQLPAGGDAADLSLIPAGPLLAPCFVRDHANWWLTAVQPRNIPKQHVWKPTACVETNCMCVFSHTHTLTVKHLLVSWDYDAEC